MSKWIDSYANHILYCSLYSGATAYALKSSRNSSGWGVLPMMLGGLASLCLCAEINYVFKRSGLPPGDSGYPILGHLVSYFSSPRDYLIKRSRKYGFPFTFNIFGIPCMVVSSDEDVRWFNGLERKGTFKPKFLSHFEKLFGSETISMQSTSGHRRLRKIFEPSFSPSSILSYLQTIDDTAQIELKKWSERKEFCESKEWAILAMRLFFNCAFGEVKEELLERLTTLLTDWFAGFTAIVSLAVPGTKLYKAHAAKNELDQILQELVDEFKTKNPPGSSGSENSMMGRLCYGVDDDGKTLSDEQLITNIRFILFAGHDTTKGSFSAFAHYLTEQPKIRTLLIDEVNAFSDPLNINELKSAPLLNAFMAETWRLVPPTDSHSGAAASYLEYKGYKIREEVVVIADIACDAMTNHERFPNPTEFHVERWLPEGHPLHDPKYYLDKVDYNVMSVHFRAFNTGPHMCLGAHFAKLEARIVLTRLLQSYNIEIRNDKLQTSPLLQYVNDFKLTKR